MSFSADIAIIGMACRFPMANSLDEFWKNLCQGKECLTHFSESELRAASSTASIIQNPHFVPVRGILSDVDKFDASFFDISPVDASIMDPQQRIFLECAWEALEHSANIPGQSNCSNMSVFAGMSDSTYLQENLLKNSEFMRNYSRFQARVATSIGMLSTQLSYRLNLRGNSVNVNTACSTGLVAVIQACQELLSGYTDLAVAGAVAVELPQVKGYVYETGGIDSPDGHCRPFAHNANGTVFSNGVGVVILKRLADAIADRDTVYAVIKGYSINNDGSDKLSYFAPSVSGQVACIRGALDYARISAADIGFVEAHGTGTALGDLIEIAALNQVYRKFTEKQQYCALGSVKSNIGHTDVASGIAGLIKTVLCLYHQHIPATLHFEKPNSKINYQESPFYVNSHLIEWHHLKNNQYAAVSAFGVGGTNAHVILSGQAALNLKPNACQEHVIIISAKSESALQKSLTNMSEYLQNNSHKDSVINLANIAYTFQVGRDHFCWRSLAVGRNDQDIINELNTAKVINCSTAEPSVIFMFPGQGSQYSLMAYQIYQRIPFFKNIVNQCGKIVQSHLSIDILELFLGDVPDARLNDTAYAQIALFIVEYALAKLLIHLGIKPIVLIGHSSGEYVAACLAGIFSLEDAIYLVCQRGQMMEMTSVGSMLAISCRIEEFVGYQKFFSIELAAHNTENQCVATGDSETITDLMAYLKQENKSFHLLKVKHAFHSRLMDEISLSFRAILSQVTLCAPQLPIVSNVTGNLLTDSEATNPDYWCQHLRNTVQFKSGINTLLLQEQPLFVEVGPGNTLSYFVDKIAQKNTDNNIITVSVLPVEQEKHVDYRQLLTMLGVVWQQGIKIDWMTFCDQESVQKIALPTYPFQRQRYWIESNLSENLPSVIPESSQSSTSTLSLQNNIRIDSKIAEYSSVEKKPITPCFFKTTWSHCSSDINDKLFTGISEHTWIIFKDKKGLGDQIISFLRKNQVVPIIIEAGNEYKQINFKHYIINPAEKRHYMHLFSALKDKISSVPIIMHLFSCNRDSKGVLTGIQIDNQLNCGFYSVLYLTQAYLENMGINPSFKCAVITECSQKVLEDDDLRPVNATLIGICRVIAQENPELKFKLMDVNLDKLENNIANLLAGMINHCTQKWNHISPVTAFRKGLRWELEYCQVELNQNINRFKDRGVYLFTGGLGDIALTLCEEIAEIVFQPVFVLVSRSAAPSLKEWEAILHDPKNHDWHDKIKRLQKLLQSGATLLIKQADVTQLQSIKSIIHETVQTYGKLNGVVHAAGIAGDGIIQIKTYNKAQAVLSPKVQGTYCLAEALSGISVDFVALCSSVSSLVGMPGQIDYCAANACLDAFAVSHLFPTNFIVSINWNTWQEIGMAVKMDRRKKISFLNIGNDITPEQGRKLFIQIMKNNYSQIAISNYSLIEFYMKISENNKFKNTQNAHTIPKDLELATQEVQLLKLWQDTLGIKNIRIEDDFFELGGDSLCALGLIDKINKNFNCQLNIQDFYVARTAERLLARIVVCEDKKINSVWMSLNAGREKNPCIFLFPPASGLLLCYNEMLSAWKFPCSIYGLQDSNIVAGRLLFNNLMGMAKFYCSELQKIQPHGSYYLVGYSFGATLAYEVAHLLKQQGQKIELLVMIEGGAIVTPEQHDQQLFKKIMRNYYPNMSSQLIDIAWQRIQLLLSHRLTKTSLDIDLFKAGESVVDFYDFYEPYNGLRQFTTGRIIRHIIKANHETIMHKENSLKIAKILKRKILKSALIVS